MTKCRQVNTYIDKDLHRAAKAKCSESGYHLSHVIQLLLRGWLEGEIELGTAHSVLADPDIPSLPRMIDL